MQHVLQKRCINYTLAILVIFGLWNFIQIFRATLITPPEEEFDFFSLFRQKKSIDDAVDRMEKLIAELQGAISETRGYKSEMENWLKHVRPFFNISSDVSGKNKALPHLAEKNAAKSRTADSANNQKAANHDGLNATVLPVLVIACNRPTVSLHIKQLLEHRVSPHRFPIIVSQDCGHEDTKRAILQYGDALTLIEYKNFSEIQNADRKYGDYSKIARHYKWALNQIFFNFNYSAVIITEDDLNIAPDFFEYFSAVYPILVKDKSLWCASAWNDNGKDALILDLPDLLHRTDFFPGLGWMMTRELWLELGPIWPPAYWDDWMRHPDRRKDRACIRPEISRTSTFGKTGVSRGQYFEQHLKFIRLNTKFIPFTQLDFSYLEKERYDADFHKQVYSSPVISMNEMRRGNFSDVPAVRLPYSDKNSFMVIAKTIGVMDDFRSGVMRMAYRGVVSIGQQGRRVYLAPAKNWTAYDTSW